MPARDFTSLVEDFEAELLSAPLPKIEEYAVRYSDQKRHQEFVGILNLLVLMKRAFHSEVRKDECLHGLNDVTERLNAVYSEEESQLDPVLEELQVQSLRTATW